MRRTVRGDLLAELVGEEFVVFDPASHRAHALDVEASRVWAALADGREGDDLLAASGCGEEQVAGVLAQLAELGLLAEPVEGPSGVARRTLLSRGAKLVAAGVALPAITTLVLPPTAAMAYGHGSPDFTGTPEKSMPTDPEGYYNRATSFRSYGGGRAVFNSTGY